jgi:hypothetical protein
MIVRRASPPSAAPLVARETPFVRPCAPFIPPPYGDRVERYRIEDHRALAFRTHTTRMKYTRMNIALCRRHHQAGPRLTTG